MTAITAAELAAILVWARGEANTATMLDAVRAAIEADRADRAA